MPQLKISETVLLCISIFSFASGARSAERSPDVVSGYLGALAYSCEQLSIIARLQKSESNYQSYLDAKVKEANVCIEEAKIKGKAAYQESMAKYPEAKDLLAKVYSKWLTHIDTMLYFFDEEKQEKTKDALTDAQNDLKAALDAQQSAI